MKLRVLALICAVLLMMTSLCACDVDDVLDRIKGMLGGGGGDSTTIVMRPEITPDGDGAPIGDGNGVPIVGVGGGSSHANASTHFRVYVNDGRELTFTDFPELAVTSIVKVDGEEGAFDVGFQLNIKDVNDEDEASAALASLHDALLAMPFVEKLGKADYANSGLFPEGDHVAYTALITVKDGYDAASLTAADFPGIEVLGITLISKNVVQLTFKNMPMDTPFDQPFVESVQIRADMILSNPQ
jgi:hypothetical protein